MWSSILLYWLISSNLLMIMSSDECHRTLLMISQHWFRWWLGAIRQQAITWTSVDQDFRHHMASLGPNELSEAGSSHPLHSTSGPHFKTKSFLDIRGERLLCLTDFVRPQGSYQPYNHNLHIESIIFSHTDDKNNLYIRIFLYKKTN